jgi:hypothetical protein
MRAITGILEALASAMPDQQAARASRGAGLNWYPNRNIRAFAMFVRIDFHGGVAVTRLQLAF